MVESEDIRPAIGIDLGTTNSRVGIWLDEENRFELISNDLGYQSTPSYVAFTETERLIGDAAKDQVSKNPANTVFDAKRLIGRKFRDLGTDADKMHIQWPFKVARGMDDKPMIHVEYKGKEKVFSAVDVYSMILGKMKDLAEVYSGSVVNGASVSVPHCFTSAQRQATRNACSLAGFETITLVNEPICAALAYTLNTIGPSLGEKKVMIFDLGGGSLDVTLFSIEEGVIEVKATSGDSQLGGEDFDLRLLHHFIQEIKQKYERDITSHPRVMRRLKKQVERVKLALSSEVETTIQIDSLLEDFNFYSSISRACFEEMNMDLFKICIKCVDECIQLAELDKADVYEVVLIGGSSRIPKVQELLAEFFNDKAKLNKFINPDEAVVCGAAARYGISSGCKAFADYLVVDVISMSLGLETIGGAMYVMLPRNSSIPRSSEQLFTTVHDDQPGIFIQVYEGENSQTCDNMLIATIEFPEIPPSPRGVPQILVRFDVDAYGILTVSAKDKTTGEKVEIYMDHEVDIDRAHHDDHRRQGLPIQAYHPSSLSEDPNNLSSSLGPHESSNTSESSLHELSEPSPAYRSSIGIEGTSQEFSEPPEAYESRNTAESRSREFSEPFSAFESSKTVESVSQEFFEPSPAFESSKTVESVSQEFFEPSPAFESSKTAESGSQEFSEASPAFESSNTVESVSQEFSEPTPAFESSKTVESVSQEFFEPSPAFESSNTVKSGSQEFFELPQAFKSSNTMESRSLEFLEPPVAYGFCDTVEQSSQEFPEPPQAHDSNSTVESKSQEFSEPQASESRKAVTSSSRVSLVQEILDTVHVITRISDFRTHKRECSTFIRRVNMLVPLFEEFRDLELSLSEEVSTCFNYLEAALNTAKDLLLFCSIGSKLWLILEQRKVAEKFLSLNTALVQALDKLPDSLGVSDEVREQVDLVHSQLKRSKALEDAVDAQLNAELISILDETNERSPNQLARLAESFKLDTASALRKELQALDGMTIEKAPGSVSMRGFEQIFGLLSDLRNLFPMEDLEQHEYSKPPGAYGSSNSMESSSQEPFAPPPPLPSNSSNSLVGRSQESSAQPPQVSGGVESRSQEFSAQPPRPPYGSSSSIEGTSPEYSKPPQVNRDEKINPQEFSAPPPRPPPPSDSSSSLVGRSQEFSAQPPQVNGGVESRSQEFSAQPPRSPYSSSNSIEGISPEYSKPPQVNRDEKINPQEFSAPPPPPLPSDSSSSLVGRSQEFSAQPPQVNGGVESRSQELSAQPPRSPYSSSNSIEGTSPEYSKPPQVNRDEKINLEEFSAPPPPLPFNSSSSLVGRSQEFSAQPPQVNGGVESRSQEFSAPPPPPLPSDSSSSLVGRSQEFSAQPPQVNGGVESRSQEFSAQPPRSPYSSSNSIEGTSPEYSKPPQVNRDEKINLEEFSAPPPPLPFNSSSSFVGRSQEFSAQPPQVNGGVESRSQELSAQPPRPPYSSSNSFEGRSLEYSEVNRDERIQLQEFSAPPPTYKSSRNFEGRPSHEYSEAPQVYRPSKTFGSKSSEFFEPTHSSSSTPESRSQEFFEYSSKPEFPEHSPVNKAWNGLEGRPPEPSEPLSTHRMSSSSGSRRYEPSEPSPVYCSTSEVSSEEFTGSGPLNAHGGMPNLVSDAPELRRSATSADEPLYHLPRPDNARSASCPQIRTSDSIIEDVVKKYTWDQVLDMTNDLTKTIGKGGFGAVYLGKLENEKEVAVKILDASSQQGITEFLNEVNLLKRVNHVNLVRLLGYCLDEKQVLIYEFAEEGSIWDHLQVGGKTLDWKTRLNIALHSACGLEYLHTGCHPRIIHRDIKSQNILITKSMVAKVADFGLSKLGADQDNISKTHVTTMVKGTLGYLDPEYLKTGQLTEKSDVYSFGVVLLEIITGRKPIQNTDKKGFIGDWVEEHYNSSSSSSRGLKSVADPTLGGHFNPKALRLVINVAKDCIHPYGIDRPEMTEVVHVLRKAQMIEHDEKKPSKWLPFL